MLRSTLFLIGTRPRTAAVRPRLLRVEHLEPRLNLSSTLIPLTSAHDLVFDDASQTLFITTGSGKVERFDLSTQQLKSPLAVGTSLNGGDLTPDGRYLYVAENVRSGSNVYVHKVNVITGEVADIAFAAGYESGVWDISILSGNRALVTTYYSGSGWTPLRQIDLTNDVGSIRSDAPGSRGPGQVSEPTSLVRSADRSYAFAAEGGISSGPYFAFDATLNAFIKGEDYAVFLDSAATAVNRDGSLVALAHQGVAIADRHLGPVNALSSEYDGGIAFDPSRDILYAVDSTADEVVAIDTHTWQPLYRLPIGENVGKYQPFSTGVMAVTQASDRLFLMTPAGVRMIDLPSATGQPIQFVLSATELTTPGTAGAVTVTARDKDGTVAQNYQGTVHFTSSDAAAILPADYTFTPEDEGVHVFSASFQSLGSHSLQIADANDPAIAGIQTGIQVHAPSKNLLLPVTDRRDLVYDAGRQLLYMTTASGMLQRFDIRTQTLLSPWQVGTSLMGADITLDGKYLYVGDLARGLRYGFIRKVDLDTGEVTSLTYHAERQESGSFDIAIAANGIALFTADDVGSAGLPLRQIELATGAISVRYDYRQLLSLSGYLAPVSTITPNADHSLLFITERGVSPGFMSAYAPATNSFVYSQSTILDSLMNSQASVDRGGSLVAVEEGSSVVIRSAATLSTVTTLTNVDGGILFDPARDYLFAVSAASNNVYRYSVPSGIQTASYDIAEDVGPSTPFGNGQMAITDDDETLFLSTTAGVRVMAVGSDYGDAPLSYGIAEHTLAPTSSSVFLGSKIDAELSSQFSALADLDDLTGIDDDDGVSLGPLYVGKTASLVVTSSAPARLSAWIDFNHDGLFINTGERVLNNVIITAGVNQLTINVPATAAIANSTFARFRVSDRVLSGPTGIVFSGEVEDYAVSIAPPPVLTVSTTATSLSEDGEEITGRVARTGDVALPLTVNLSINDASEASIPATVIIPAGEAFVEFPIRGVDDDELDGSQPLVISADALNCVPGSIGVTVTDVEVLTLSLPIGVVAENSGVLLATLTRRNTDLAQELSVTLLSSDILAATVPPTVVIPSGEQSITFEISVIDDRRLDGSQTTSLSAAAAGYFGAAQSLTVLDHETFDLSVAASEVKEGTKTVATITRSNVDDVAPLELSVAEDGSSELILPSTITIPAGQASFSFDVMARHDLTREEDTQATIVVESPEFGAVSSVLTLHDVPPLTNPDSPFDVNRDGVIDVQDVIDLIRFLRRQTSEIATTLIGPPYYDSDANGAVSVNDAVVIVRFLRRRAVSEGEGEPKLLDAPANKFAANDLLFAFSSFTELETRNKRRSGDGHDLATDLPPGQRL